MAPTRVSMGKARLAHFYLPLLLLLHVPVHAADFSSDLSCLFSEFSFSECADDTAWVGAEEFESNFSCEINMTQVREMVDSAGVELQEIDADSTQLLVSLIENTSYSFAFDDGELMFIQKVLFRRWPFGVYLEPGEVEQVLTCFEGYVE